MKAMQRRVNAVAALPVVLFLCISGLYLIRTPAWDNNDEADHVRYVEHIVATGKLPGIAVGNGTESHQPPLYYAIVAVWQRAVGVSAFTPSLIPASPAHRETAGWVLSHDYDQSQRQAAIDLRVLRLPSLLFGALTVVAAYLAVQLMFRQRGLSVAIATLVAVWPKFDVVSAAVTNDILADALCAWLFVLVLMCRGRSDRRASVWLAAGIGALCAAAALTKYTTLPVVGVLGGYVVVLCALRHRWISAVTTAATAIALAGWWFVFEWSKYGDPLAAQATTSYLRRAIPGLLWPVPTLDPRVLLGFPLHQFTDSIWWDGDWNQLLLPHRLNLLLGVLALAAIGVSFVWGRQIKSDPGPDGVVPFELIALGAAATFISLLLVVRETTQFEGRYLFVGIVPLAVLLVIGLRSLLRSRARLEVAATWMWPALLFTLNLYVMGRYLIAHGGL